MHKKGKTDGVQRASGEIRRRGLGEDHVVIRELAKGAWHGEPTGRWGVGRWRTWRGWGTWPPLDVPFVMGPTFFTIIYITCICKPGGLCFSRPFLFLLRLHVLFLHSPMRPSQEIFLFQVFFIWLILVVATTAITILLQRRSMILLEMSIQSKNWKLLMCWTPCDLLCVYKSHVV